MPVELLYHTLSARVVSGLVDEALAIGLFASAFVFVRRATLDPGWERSLDFFRQLLLLFSIVLFFVYVDISYEVELYKGLSSPAASVLPSTPTSPPADPAPAKLLLMLMLPIDVVGIALMAGLFGVVISNSVGERNRSGPNVSTIREVAFLLTLTAAWHISMLCWWVVYRCFSAGPFDLAHLVNVDTYVHAGYAAAELVGARLLMQSLAWRSAMQRSGLVATVAVAGYSIALLSLYAVRLWDYSGRFLQLLSDRLQVS